MNVLCLILWIWMFIHTAFLGEDNFKTVKWYALCAEVIAMIHYIERLM